MAEYSLWSRIEEPAPGKWVVTVSAVALRSKADTRIADILRATCRTRIEAQHVRDQFVAELHRRLPGRGDSILSIEGD